LRLQVLCVGRLKAGPERELVARYGERIAPAGRPLGLGPVDIREVDESRARRAGDRKIDEALRLAALLPEGAVLWALDQTGANLSSEDFARDIAKLRAAGTSALAFAIGGADGFDESLLLRANRKIAFGKLTLPHQIVRVVLLEQIYRATTILSGHPYHRG
jgi:23S rRNA (pseudouridine1915-N3)-methyltransferase